MKKNKILKALTLLLVPFFIFSVNLNAKENIDIDNVEGLRYYENYSLSTGKEVNIYRQYINNSFLAREDNLSLKEIKELDKHIDVLIEKEYKPKTRGDYYESTPDGKIKTYFTKSGKTHKFTKSGGYSYWGRDSFMIYKPTGQVVFCLNMFDPVGSVSNGSSASEYNKLSYTNKQIVDRYSVIGTDNYYRLKNSNLSKAEDYLFATSSHIWDITNKGYSKNTFGAQWYYDDLTKQYNDSKKYPSFSKRDTSSTVTHTLKYNSKTKKYEITLTDKNGIWDKHFAYYGKVGDYTLSNPSGANNVKISTSNTNAKDLTLSPSNISKFRWDPASHIPSSARKSIYIGTQGQDVFTSISKRDPVSIKFTLKVEPALGTASLTKVNQNGVKLKGVKFGIYDSKNKLVDTKVTDSNGYLKTKKLLQGNYYAKELSVPTNDIVMSNTKYNFTIKANQNTIISNGIVNQQQGKIYIDYIKTTMNEEEVEVSFQKEGYIDPKKKNINMKIYNNDKLISTIKLDLTKIKNGVIYKYKVPIISSSDNMMKFVLENTNGSSYKLGKTLTNKRKIPSKEKIKVNTSKGRKKVSNFVSSITYNTKDGKVTYKLFWEYLNWNNFKVQEVEDGIFNLTGEFWRDTEITSEDNSSKVGTWELLSPLKDSSFMFNQKNDKNYHLSLEYNKNEKTFKIKDLAIENHNGRVYNVNSNNYKNPSIEQKEIFNGARDGMDKTTNITTKFPLPSSFDSKEYLGKSFTFFYQGKKIGRNEVDLTLEQKINFNKKMFSIFGDKASHEVKWNIKTESNQETKEYVKIDHEDMKAIKEYIKANKEYSRVYLSTLYNLSKEFPNIHYQINPSVVDKDHLYMAKN